jgi:hypothetical protein
MTKIFVLAFIVCAGILFISCGGGSVQPQRVLSGLTVQPTNADAVEPDGTVPFSATASFNQPPTTQTGYPAHWISSDSNVATIDPNSGVATCLTQGGPISITASSGGVQASAILTCSPSLPLTGNCVYACGSTRCGALTGYCSGSGGGQCRQAYDPVHCPAGQPAESMATNACGIGIDTSRTCTP